MQLSLFPEPPPIIALPDLAISLIEELQTRYPLKRRVTLEWRELRTTAGLANWAQYRIILSRQLMTDADRLERTLKHEYAHLLAVDRHGRRAAGHGAAWKQAMHDLGETPEVCHTYDCRRNESRQVVVYRCAKCLEAFERRRRLPRGRKFLHFGCGGEVQFVRREAI